MKRISVFLTEPQIDTLKAMAQIVGVPMAEFLRRIVDEALRKDTREPDRHTHQLDQTPQRPE